MLYSKLNSMYVIKTGASVISGVLAGSAILYYSHNKSCCKSQCCKSQCCKSQCCKSQCVVQESTENRT